MDWVYQVACNRIARRARDIKVLASGDPEKEQATDAQVILRVGRLGLQPHTASYQGTHDECCSP